jgi:hypothetical protein
MSAFMMALAAGMAVGNAVDGTSTEAHQGLDLRGSWKGELSVNGHDPAPVYASSAVLITTQWRIADHAWTLTDEGEGKGVRIEIWGQHFAGIYRQEGDRLTICFRNALLDRPRSFRRAEGQYLLILRRIKPGK